MCLNCKEILKHESLMLYIPTPPSTCASRITQRNRTGEVERPIPESYLTQLDRNHQAMVNAFENERGSSAVIRLDAFNNHLTESEISVIVDETMNTIRKIAESTK